MLSVEFSYPASMMKLVDIVHPFHFDGKNPLDGICQSFRSSLLETFKKESQKELMIINLNHQEELQKLLAAVEKKKPKPIGDDFYTFVLKQDLDPVFRKSLIRFINIQKCISRIYVEYQLEYETY